MATNTHTRPGERAHEHTTAATAVRALLASVAGTLVALLPAFAVLGAVLLSFSNPGIAFVFLGVPAAAALGVALAFGVARAGAEIASRI